MQRACELLASAETIYIVAQRRSFPVAAYFAYALGHLGLHAHLVDGMGGMAEQQAAAMRTDDALIMVSFHPYAEETQQIARVAWDRGVPAVAITDSPLSPICQLGDPVFEVHDGEVQSFRSLTATMTLAISLVVALGQRLDLSLGGACGHTAETHDRDE
jgi:DNA-binding MurR/RpiR family transcriptional regulator